MCGRLYGLRLNEGGKHKVRRKSTISKIKTTTQKSLGKINRKQTKEERMFMKFMLGRMEPENGRMFMKYMQTGRTMSKNEVNGKDNGT